MMDYTEHRNMMKSTFHIPKQGRSDKRNGIKEPELVKRIADVKEKIVLPFDGLKHLSEKICGRFQSLEKVEESIRKKTSLCQSFPIFWQ